MASLELEATELRLGLPGGGGGGGQDGGTEGNMKSSGKRGFAETIDLKLKLHRGGVEAEEASGEAVAAGSEKMKRPSSQKNLAACSSEAEPKPPAPKAQVVGWPPVRSFRKNVFVGHSDHHKLGTKQEASEKSSAAFIKVSMDGAPYLRKVDLKMYKSYQELSMALEKMFSSFTSAGNCGSQGMDGFKDFMNENKLMDLLSGSDYVPTYEDKDGDWMLVGDVPWEMFVESCKRLRIMKGSEATGLAPRTMEKCKNRS